MISKEEWNELKKKESILKKASDILGVEEKDLPRVLDRFLKEIAGMKSK
jgi:hypothetical protein